MERRNLWGLVICVLGCSIGGWLASLFTRSAIPVWYSALRKPSFTPPNAVFGPVWGILYIMMGVAVFLIWRKGARHPGVRFALNAFAAQLLLNILWSPLFFGLRSPLAGLLDIALLCVVLSVTVAAFLRVSRTAGALLIPYLLWVLYATALNVGILWLN